MDTETISSQTWIHKSNETIKAITQKMNVFEWFHYAQYSVPHGMIGIFVGPAAVSGKYNPACSPPDNVIREILEDTTKENFGIARME